MTLIEHELADLSEAQQAHYRQCLKNGCTQQMALMLASRQAAMMGGSDQAFNQGQRRKMNEMTGFNRDKILQIAQKAGINTNGKYYVGGLGRYEDKHAWVSTVDDVKEVLKLKNLDCEGLVKHKGHEVPPPEPKLAEDIEARLVAKRVAQKTKGRKPTAAKLRHIVGEAREYVSAVHAKPRGQSPD